MSSSSQLIFKDQDDMFLESLKYVFEALADNITLCDLAEIHTGVHYQKGLLQNSISRERKPHFMKGVAKVQGYFEPYVITEYDYFFKEPQLGRNSSNKLSWEHPKVLVNRSRTSQGFWSIAAAVDTEGLWAGLQFYGVWSKKDTPIEVLAAILCGPVANAFLLPYPSKQQSLIRWLNKIPVPQFTQEQTELIVRFVQEYRTQRGNWLVDSERAKKYQQRCLQLLYLIDAIVLEAYALPSALESGLLEMCVGAERSPLPFDFSGYSDEFERTKEILHQEKHYHRVSKRYHTLVDKKYQMGLTNQEADEMAQLANQLDEADAPFYEPILEAYKKAVL